MRLVVNSLIALMLGGILVGLVMYHTREDKSLTQHKAVHDALTTIYNQALYHGTLDEVETTRTGFPLVVLPAWFDGAAPTNPMAPASQPWLDIAPPKDMGDNPPDPVITSPKQAGFWYNPNRGIFRARVSPQETEQATLQLYNALNNTALTTLARDFSDKRAPRTIAATLADLAANANTKDVSTDSRSSNTVTAPSRRRGSLSDRLRHR